MKNRIQSKIAIMLLLLATGCNNQQKQRDMETETQTKSEVTQTTTAISKDDTAIAYEKTGQGPGLILINGALADRKVFEKGWTAMLAKNFTVITYDRRGRGESADTKPYAVEREIEDIEALIDKAGGSVYIFGSSSGAALALLAAEKLGPEKVTKLALYEPPYGSDTKEEYAKEKKKVNELVADGKVEDAVTFFMERRGVSPDQMQGMKKSPAWNGMVGMGHTLIYDLAVLGDGEIPVDIARKISIPTLVMDGEKSFDFMAATADNVGKSIPGALRKTIKGQMHNPSPESVVPVLVEFFGK
jgi:pimeloyl-ACP methyl ester carboxylesterase